MVWQKALLAAFLSTLIFLHLPSVAQEPIDADVQAVVDSYNQTALDLYQELRAEPGNLVISPYSIGAAMAMALSGARGDTETEMAEVLHQPPPREERDAANAALMETLGRFEKNDDITLAVANALALGPLGEMISPSFRDLITTRYGGELFQAQSVSPINAWVAEKTEGKIQELLQDLDPTTACVLLNAIYFKANWAYQFKETSTRPEPFFLPDGNRVTVAMMHQSNDFHFVEHDTFVALELPYEDPSLSMILLLPRVTYGVDKDGIISATVHSVEDVEKGLDAETVQSFLDKLREGEPRYDLPVSLPRFKLKSARNLRSNFQTLGMARAFSEEVADFSGMTGNEDPGELWIGDIHHQAVLEVNETGAEAAAATAVVMGLRGLPPEFRADRPFLFLVVDRSSDLILFMGRVVKPDEAPATLALTRYTPLAKIAGVMVAVVGGFVLVRRRGRRATGPQ